MERGELREREFSREQAEFLAALRDGVSADDAGEVAASDRYLFLAGEPGTGKTEVATRLASTGSVSFGINCSERGRNCEGESRKQVCGRCVVFRGGVAAARGHREDEASILRRRQIAGQLRSSTVP